MSEAKPAPLGARVVRWAMLQRRRGIYVPADVVNVLVCLAERYSRDEGLSRPGFDTLGWDVGAGTKDTLRKWILQAERLGAIVYTPGQGRRHASEIRFADDVWQAPQLDELARLDAYRNVEAAAKGTSSPRAQRPRGGSPSSEKGRTRFALFRAEKGEQTPGKGRADDEKRANPEAEKDEPASPPTAVVPLVPLEPLLRPAAASISPTTDSGNGDDHGDGNGATTGTEAPTRRKTWAELLLAEEQRRDAQRRAAP